MELNHGFSTHRSREPEVERKGKGVTVGQVITRSGVDGCADRKWGSPAGSQQGNRRGESRCWC